MAQNSMINPLQSAILGPDILARQLRLQQQQQFGQQMMQQGAQAPQGQMVSGHYVAPSITQHLSQGLKGFLGMKAMNDLPDKMSDLGRAQSQGMQNLFGTGTPSASVASNGTQAFPVGASPKALAGGLRGQSTMPGIPGMSREQQAMLASQVGLGEYLKIAANKGGPVNLAPGGSLYNPQTGQVDYTAPKDGIAIQGGRAVEVPGFGEIAARNAGTETAATEGAKAQFDLVDVPDGQGGTVKMPRSQAIQALDGRPQGQSVPAAGGLGHAPSKEIIAARNDLPKLTGQFDQIENTINQILKHPGLEAGTGLSSYFPSFRDESRDFDALAAQLQGQVFLQAYESLKGGGVITDFEGAKAESALARSQKAQTKDAYVEAIKEFLSVVQTAKARAYEKAGMPMPGSGKAPPAANAAKYDRAALEAEARRRGLLK